MRYAFLFLFAGACTQAPADVNLNITCTSPDSTVTDPDAVDDTDPGDTDGASEIPEYTGERAVLEGWMALNGIQYGSGTPGEIYDLGMWSFELTPLDGLAHSAIIRPTGFDFQVESDGDHRFGTPVDTVVASDIIDHCWFLLGTAGTLVSPLGPSDIGSPEINTMSSSNYPEIEITTDFPLDLWFRCEARSDAPLGTKVSVAMNYTVISGTDVYDASTAREDNRGVNPNYFIQIGPDTCGNYDLTQRYGDLTGTVCSLPALELNTTATYYVATSRRVALDGTFHVLDGKGGGSIITELAVNITDLPEETLFATTTVTFYLGGSSASATCTPVSGAGNEIWCEVSGLSYTVFPSAQRLVFSAIINSLPIVPDGTRMNATTYFHWKDAATSRGTDGRGGWSVIDGDSQFITPYTPNP